MLCGSEDNIGGGDSTEIFGPLGSALSPAMGYVHSLVYVARTHLVTLCSECECEREGKQVPYTHSRTCIHIHANATLGNARERE